MNNKIKAQILLFTIHSLNVCESQLHGVMSICNQSILQEYFPSYKQLKSLFLSSSFVSHTTSSNLWHAPCSLTLTLTLMKELLRLYEGQIRLYGDRGAWATFVKYCKRPKLLQVFSTHSLHPRLFIH